MESTSVNAGHNTEDVVIDRVHSDLRPTAHCLRRELKLERSIIYPTEVASSGRLVLLRLESEGVHVNTGGRNVGMMLVGLHKVEVRTKALLEAIVAVKLELSADDRVTASVARSKTSVVRPVTSVSVGAEVSRGIAHSVGTGTEAILEVNTVAEQSADLRRGGAVAVNLHVREGGGGPARLNVGVNSGEAVGGNKSTSVTVEVVSVVGPLVDTALNNVVTLDNPDKLLNRMVEIELNLDVGVDGRLITSELQLLDQVLVGDLGETATLISVEVDVVNKQSGELKRGHTQSSGSTAVKTIVARGRGRDKELVLVTELEADADLVVLQSNQRKSQTGVAAEPKLEGHVQSSGLGAVKTSTGEGNGVTDHVVVTNLVTRLDGELGPDVKPVTVVFVNALSTDLDLDRADELVTNVVDPAEASRAIRALNRGKSSLKVHAVNQITVTANSSINLAAEVGKTVEGLLDGLHSEVSVTTVDNLEEGNLRVTCKIDVLCPVRNQLH